MPITVKLSRPIKTHEGDKSEVTFRDITARDLVLLKRPILTPTLTADGGTRFDVDYELALKYMEKLSGVDEISLGGMSAIDMQNCVNAIATLFNGDDAKN